MVVEGGNQAVRGGRESRHSACSFSSNLLSNFVSGLQCRSNSSYYLLRIVFQALHISQEPVIWAHHLGGVTHLSLVASQL